MAMYDSSYTGAQVDARLEQVKAMGASGSNHSAGLVPDPGETQGTTKFLREDGSWQVPAAGDTNVIETVKVNGTALTPDANKAVDIKGIITRTDVTGTSVTQTLTPNVFYSFGTMTSLTVTLGSVVSGVNNVYSFEFTSGSTATTLTLPNTIVWQDTVTIEANTHYEISIKYAPQVSAYYGMISSWDIS